jgi:hypothetical protein
VYSLVYPRPAAAVAMEFSERVEWTGGAKSSRELEFPNLVPPFSFPIRSQLAFLIGFSNENAVQE